MFSWLFKRSKPSLGKDALKKIDPDALDIVRRLKKAGFETYLVGGCVRDLLLGATPKDFDISTAATPQQVKSIIHRSFIIGRRFRIVVAKRNDRKSGPSEELFPVLGGRPAEKEFQITTFRRDPVEVDGQINENVFGSAKDDAFRRDFTLNALFLDPDTLNIIDFVGGLDDLAQGRLRVIGDPVHRFKEDPIRMLRALRFSARASLKLERGTHKALEQCLPELAQAKRERIREEFLKVLREKHSAEMLGLLSQHQAWPYIAPLAAKKLEASYSLLGRILKGLDANRWPRADQAPLFFLFFLGLNPSLAQGRGLSTLDSLVEELKVSRAESECMERIQLLLSRWARSFERDTPDRRKLFNISSLGQFETAAAAIFVAKVLAHCDIDPYSKIWRSLEKVWKEELSALGSRMMDSPGARRRPRRSRGPRSSSRAASTTGSSGLPSSSTSSGSSSTTSKRSSST